MIPEYLAIVFSFICIQGFVTGVLLWKLHKREAARERLDEARRENGQLLVKSVRAAIALGEATARSVQRLDPACNGEMARALEYAQQVKCEQNEFLDKLRTENLR